MLTKQQKIDIVEDSKQFPISVRDLKGRIHQGYILGYGLEFPKAVYHDKFSGIDNNVEVSWDLAFRAVYMKTVIRL